MCLVKLLNNYSRKNPFKTYLLALLGEFQYSISSINSRKPVTQADTLCKRPRGRMQSSPRVLTSNKSLFSPKSIHPYCVGGFPRCLRQGETSSAAPQAEETGSNQKFFELGTEIPLESRHPAIQVYQCHLSLETAASHTVPQEEVLSYLLFNIKIDDLEKAIQMSYLFFANDVVIWATSSNIHTLEDTLSSSLLNLATWVDTNKLEIIVEKTVFQLLTLSTK
ncbi:hypothetical protein TNIN_498011 [Trichonephila inaurata madagascariensis]|uniref:Reverse transcriptase domain-containing protein n=1 Tax=Trichonephila inaurata madagascariensis TaxID=2747483 RepID=A0A8X6YDP5_9ARAC|nr:hypothetical protein TNIN_498011 [Trichonephila inaurata madagascariensis]